jgi:hypothetical protein
MGEVVVGNLQRGGVIENAGESWLLLLLNG